MNAQVEGTSVSTGAEEEDDWGNDFAVAPALASSSGRGRMCDYDLFRFGILFLIFLSLLHCFSYMNIMILLHIPLFIMKVHLSINPSITHILLSLVASASDIRDSVDTFADSGMLQAKICAVSIFSIHMNIIDLHFLSLSFFIQSIH